MKLHQPFLFLVLLALSLAAVASAEITIEIDPLRKRQAVQWGADIKLTLKSVDQGNTAAVIDRFQELEMTVLRLPIFATRKLDDPFHDKVYRVAKLGHEAGMKIFLSVANGNGTGKDLHNASKFGDFLKSSNSNYLYKLGPQKYGAYLTGHLDALAERDIPVAVLGPFNEDPAKASALKAVFTAVGRGDYKRIGLETWSLKSGLSKARGLAGEVDIIGSHCYDDDKVIADSIWYQLSENATRKPTWFTESTRYRASGDSMEDTRTGIEHFISAVRGGAECIIIYQTAGRIVKYDANVRPRKFGSLKHFIANSRGAIVGSRTTSDDISTVTFRDDDKLQVHITHRGDNDESVRLSLLGPLRLHGDARRATWTDTDELPDKMIVAIEQDDVVLTLPPNSYIQLTGELSRR